MTIELLAATMNGRLPRFLEGEPLAGCSAVVVNQYTRDSDRLSTSPLSNVRVFNYAERGVARSRNRALEHASAEIGVLCDDDTLLVPGFAARVAAAFAAHPDADILTFRIRTPDGTLYKKYKARGGRHTRFSLLSVSEVEIAFRIDAIRRHDLRFDEQFGLGATFPTGEGNIFIADALKKGLVARYVAEEIVVHPFRSSGKRFAERDLMYAKGALCRRIYGPFLGRLMSWAFVVAKYRWYRAHYGWRTAVDLVNRGARDWAALTHR